MADTVIILNGPNLNMLGSREPEVYGKDTLADIEKKCADAAKPLGLATDFRQSNHEGELTDWIQQANGKARGLIINPGGLGHTSVALLDALMSVKLPAIEVHISNIYKREDFRHHTYTSRGVQGVICGFGSHGYVLALQAMSDILRKNHA